MELLLAVTAMLFYVKVSFQTNEDMEYVQRMSYWCMLQGIRLRIRQLEDKASLQFSGDGQAMQDLLHYLEQR